MTRPYHSLPTAPIPRLCLAVWLLLSMQQLHRVEARYGYLRSKRVASTRVDNLATQSHHLQEQVVDVSPLSLQHHTLLHLDASYASYLQGSYVHPFSLNPNCAAGIDVVVGVTQLHIEAIDRTTGELVFASSVRRLFRTMTATAATTAAAAAATTTTTDEGQQPLLPRGAEPKHTRILYDATHDRFVILSTMTDQESYSKLCLAISKNGLPETGTETDWDLFVIDVWDLDAAEQDHYVWANELEIAVDDDQAIYVSATMYKTTVPEEESEEEEAYVETNEFVESRVWILPKIPLYTNMVPFNDHNRDHPTRAAPLNGTLYGFDETVISSVTVLEHVDDNGHNTKLGPYVPAPTASEDGAILWIARTTDPNQVRVGDNNEYLHVVRMTNVLFDPPTIISSNLVSLGDIENSEEPLPPAQQPGISNSFNSDTYQPIEMGSRRVADATCYNNTLHIALMVREEGGQTTSVFWAKVDLASLESGGGGEQEEEGVLLVSDRITAPATSTFYPSIAVNPKGDMVLGYGASGSELYAGMYATLVSPREVSFTIEIQEGEANYESIDGRPFHGQYSGLSLDPVDLDCFWAWNAFARANDPWLWHTWERGALSLQWGKICAL